MVIKNQIWLLTINNAGDIVKTWELIVNNQRRK